MIVNILNVLTFGCVYFSVFLYMNEVGWDLNILMWLFFEYINSINGLPVVRRATRAFCIILDISRYSHTDFNPEVSMSESLKATNLSFRLVYFYSNSLISSFFSHSRCEDLTHSILLLTVKISPTPFTKKFLWLSFFRNVCFDTTNIKAKNRIESN